MTGPGRCHAVRHVLPRRRRAGPAARSDRDGRALPAAARRAGRRLGRGGVPGHVPVGALRPPRPGLRRVLRVRRLGRGGAGRGRRRRPGRARAGDGRRRTAGSPHARGRRGRWSPARRCRSTSSLDSRPTATSWSPSTVRRCRCRQTERGCGRSTRPARSSSPAERPGARSTPWSPPPRRRSGSPARTAPAGPSPTGPVAPGSPRVSRPSGTPTTVRSSTPTPAPTDLTVPAGPLHVVAARGIEFARLEVDVTPAAGETVTVAYDPERRFDPAADGWYGADLHVHLNYSGDHVLEPADAVRMQRGEGLALMHLTRATWGVRSSTTWSCWRRRRARTCGRTARSSAAGWSSATRCSGTCTASA